MVPLSLGIHATVNKSTPGETLILLSSRVISQLPRDIALRVAQNIVIGMPRGNLIASVPGASSSWSM